MRSGSILHINAVGLLAALEEIMDSGLRGRPFLVARALAPRASVLDVSEKAHEEGLRPGMSLTEARRRFPGIEIRPPRQELAVQSHEVMTGIAFGFSPLVESAGAGHLFIDVAGTERLHGSAEDVAQKIRAAIARATGLRPAVALASGKTASKIATRVFRPGGFVALSYRDEAQLIACQPVALLPGVGPLLLGRLTLLDIGTIGSLAGLSDLESRALGPRGPSLVARARCTDDTPVDPSPAARRNLSGSFLFEPDCMDPHAMLLGLSSLVADLGFQLRRGGSGALRVSLRIGYTDGLASTPVTVRSLRPLSRDDELANLAAAALHRALQRRVRVRSIHIELSGLGPAGPELDLFEPPDTDPRNTFPGTCFGLLPDAESTSARLYGRIGRLQGALDRVRSRHGATALRRAGILVLGNAEPDGSAEPRIARSGVSR